MFNQILENITLYGLYISFLCRYLLFYTVLRTFLVFIPILFPNEGHSTHTKYGTKYSVLVKITPKGNTNYTQGIFHFTMIYPIHFLRSHTHTYTYTQTGGGRERWKNSSTALCVLSFRTIKENVTVNVLFTNSHFTHSVFLIMNVNTTTYFRLSK